MTASFFSLLGNEIQNDLWDYHPMTVTDKQLKGEYRGGYWYEDDKDRVNSRYAFHFISKPSDVFTHSQTSAKESIFT